MFLMSEIRFKLPSVNVIITSLPQLVDKSWAGFNLKEFMDFFAKVSNTKANDKTSTCN